VDQQVDIINLHPVALSASCGTGRGTKSGDRASAGARAPQPCSSGGNGFWDSGWPAWKGRAASGANPQNHRRTKNRARRHSSRLLHVSKGPESQAHEVHPPYNRQPNHSSGCIASRNAESRLIAIQLSQASRWCLRLGDGLLCVSSLDGQPPRHPPHDPGRSHGCPPGRAACTPVEARGLDWRNRIHRPEPVAARLTADERQRAGHLGPRSSRGAVSRRSTRGLRISSSASPTAGLVQQLRRASTAVALTP
jgi:hypothetical protein